jgi:chromosome segregation ATPase
MGYIEGSRKLIFHLQTKYESDKQALLTASRDLHEITSSNVQLRQTVDLLHKEVDGWKGKYAEATQELKEGSPDSLLEDQLPRAYLEAKVAELENELEESRKQCVDAGLEILAKQSKIDELEIARGGQGGFVEIEQVSPLSLGPAQKRRKARKHN